MYRGNKGMCQGNKGMCQGNKGVFQGNNDNESWQQGYIIGSKGNSLEIKV